MTSYASLAQDHVLESIGGRVGGSFTSRTHDFHQAEAFANWNLPWEWDLECGWRLQLQLQCSAGWLGDPGGNAFVGTVGPSVLFFREHLPVSFDAGVSPTFLSRHDFQTKDFGSYFQFTAHAGVNWEASSHFRIGYRFQHMSNAGLGWTNPGLNLHALALSYKF